jgi:hypothetical protein
MTMDRMRVANWDRWGRLVKTWATGENRLKDGNEYPVPRTLQEFKDQCARAQVGLTLPEEVKAFAVVAYDPHTLVLRLPPKERIEESEAHIQKGGGYPLPDFYAPCFGKEAGTPPGFASVDAVLAFHDRRIGDYTIALCA